MKKITLSVAALSLAISGFCTNPPTNQQLIKEITINVEDIIEFVKEDEYNGRMMTETLAKSYINNLLNNFHCHHTTYLLQDIQIHL